MGPEDEHERQRAMLSRLKTNMLSVMQRRRQDPLPPGGLLHQGSGVVGGLLHQGSGIDTGLAQHGSGVVGGLLHQGSGIDTGLAQHGSGLAGGLVKHGSSVSAGLAPQSNTAAIENLQHLQYLQQQYLQSQHQLPSPQQLPYASQQQSHVPQGVGEAGNGMLASPGVGQFGGEHGAEQSLSLCLSGQQQQQRRRLARQQAMGAAQGQASQLHRCRLVLDRLLALQEAEPFAEPVSVAAAAAAVPAAAPISTILRACLHAQCDNTVATRPLMPRFACFAALPLWP
jgi:hypothetical protein